MDSEKKMTLLDLGIEGIQIYDLLEESMGELTPELEERLDALMKGGAEKIDAALAVRRRLDAEAEFIGSEINRLQARKKSLESQKGNLSNRIVFALDNAFSGKIKTVHNTAWTVKGRTSTLIGLAPDADMEQVRTEYPELVEVSYSLDSKAIKALDPENIPNSITVDEKTGPRFLQAR